MAIHRLNGVTIGVPDPVTTGAFYRELGLDETRPGRFATTDGGDQLELVATPRRRLVELRLGCETTDDLDRIARRVTNLGPPVEVSLSGESLRIVEPVTRTEVRVEVTAPMILAPRVQAPFNTPGAYERFGARAEGILREGPVRPRKLSHVVIGSPDAETTQRFFVEGLGFKISDSIAGVGAFLRCSTEHHNVLVQSAPVPFLHHTSWQVDDVDEIGRGAAAMLAVDPNRHIWGLGRHFIGSNFFWYLKDPAGNFAEYSSDIDVIVDDELWQPEVWDGMRSLMAWGPNVPASFIAPDDLAELMTAGA
jgi:catechol 2,3-dioxygenase-like lactoylglutathione lyase family enzyme